MLSQSLITRPATFFPVLARARSAEYTLRGTIMTAPATDETDLLRRANEGDQQALATLFARYRDRLRKMVRLRLDRRLYGRIDTSDVLQDAYLEVARRFPEYAASPTVPFFIWLRSADGAAARRCASPQPGRGDAQCRAGGLAVPRPTAGGLVRVAGAAPAGRPDVADTGRHSGGDAASAA